MISKFKSKRELATELGISMDVLRKYLNTVYFKELQSIGYSQCAHLLTPKQCELIREKLLSGSNR